MRMLWSDSGIGTISSFASCSFTFDLTVSANRIKFDVAQALHTRVKVWTVTFSVAVSGTGVWTKDNNGSNYDITYEWSFSGTVAVDLNSVLGYAGTSWGSSDETALAPFVNDDPSPYYINNNDEFSVPQNPMFGGSTTTVTMGNVTGTRTSTRNPPLDPEDPDEPNEVVDDFYVESIDVSASWFTQNVFDSFNALSKPYIGVNTVAGAPVGFTHVNATMQALKTVTSAYYWDDDAGEYVLDTSGSRFIHDIMVNPLPDFVSHVVISTADGMGITFTAPNWEFGGNGSITFADQTIVSEGYYNVGDTPEDNAFSVTWDISASAEPLDCLEFRKLDGTTPIFNPDGTANLSPTNTDEIV